MRTTANIKTDTTSEETSESINLHPVNTFTAIFEGTGLSQMETLLASEEEANELQEYLQDHPDFNTRPKTIVRQFVIAISKTNIQTVEILGLHDLRIPSVSDLGLPEMIDLESYWDDTPNIKITQKPS